MGEKSSRNRGYRTALWATVVLTGVALTLTLAQDVILNPVEITGQVRIGTEPISSVTIRTTSGSLVAFQSFTPDAADLTKVDYSLTVDVPEGGDRIYAVQPDSIFMDGGRDRLSLQAKDVLVADGTPGSVDFIIDPGYLEGTFALTGGDVMTEGIVNGLYAESPSSDACGGSSQAPCFTTRTNADSSFTYRIAVPPGREIRLRPVFVLQSGSALWLDPITVDIAAGETVVRDFVAASPEGSVSGTIEMPGSETVFSHNLFLENPVRRRLFIFDSDGPYQISSLPDDNYTLLAESTFRHPSMKRQTFSHPGASYVPGFSFTIAEGSQETVDISTAQAYLEGTIAVTGSAVPEDLTNIFFSTLDVSPEASGASSSGVLEDPGMGAYRYVVSEGIWRASRITLSMARAGIQLSDQFTEDLTFNFSQLGTPEIQVTTGQTSTYDMTFPMGKVIVRFGRTVGLPLRLPQLSFSCPQFNEAGRVTTFVSGFSHGKNQVDVTDAVISFLAPAGDCRVTALAFVDGTFSNFGQVEVRVEPGITKEVEVGEPTLTWTPADGSTTSVATVEVTGTADDAEGIASITVNGADVSFALTGNLSQPNEVTFTTTATLVSRNNDITVVATNVSDLQITQTHTVTLLGNIAPLADAGDDIAQPCSSPCNGSCATQVTLDGSGSSDEDGDDLIYTWTGPFPEGNGTVTGITTVVTLPLGASEITLSVDDGTAQSTDTVMVTVEVEVVGLKTPLAGLVPAGKRPPLPRRAFNPGNTLPLRFTLRCGESFLTANDIAAPEIVSLVDERRVPVDLALIDADAGASNDNTPFFRYGDDDDGQWIYNLKTSGLTPRRTYTITIRMPGEQDYQARFSIRNVNGRSRRSARRR